PDGSRVAFVWQIGENSAIYVKLIGSGDPVRITQDPASYYSSPAWSPDGRWIAALRDVGNHSNVLIIPASGGRERELSQVPQGFPGFFYGTLLAWSPDCKFLFTS